MNTNEHPEFLGKHPIKTELQVIEAKPPYLLDFYAYERIGVTVYKDMPDPIDLSKAEPWTDKDHGPQIGDKFIITGVFGEPIRCFIDEGGEGWSVGCAVMLCPLHWDNGHPDVGIPGEWVCSGMGNARALAQIDFQ